MCCYGNDAVEIARGRRSDAERVLVGSPPKSGEVCVTDELPEHLVLLGWNDLAAVTRLRGFPSRLAESVMKSGLGYAAAGQAITPFGGIAPNRWGPMEEVRQ